MPDIESDTSNNIFNSQNDNITVNAKSSNSFSCRNPMPAMYNMSRNYEQPRYAESAYDQRSMYYRRETSPMSMMSIGSSISAVDIAFAFKNGKLGKNGLKMIRDTCQKLLKQRVRKRIEKRRNIRLKFRRRSGDNSGNQASDSSVSSDDCGSVKTCEENMSSSRSTSMDLTEFRKTIKDSNIAKNSLENLSQNTLKNKFSIGSGSINNTKNYKPNQKDIFLNKFLLPSQRFNRSIASSAIMEKLSNDFEFAKPALPIRKSKPKTKAQRKEKLIAKSAQSLTDFLEPIPNKLQENIKNVQPSNLREKSNDDLTQLDRSDTTQNTAVSSRPSCIKRKLFTQNQHVAEKTNLTTDATNSPQSSVHSLQKEKNKSRKLVKNELYLNKEVKNNNNLLDLIHKKVPPDRMNITNQTTINQNIKDDSKCTVTSISVCNEDDVSNTFTDKEMFETDSTIKLTAKNKELNSKAKPIDKLEVKPVIMLRDCYVMLKRLENNNTMQNKVVNQNFESTHNDDTKNNPKNLAKTFWDTDFESDAECEKIMPPIHLTDNLKEDNATPDPTKQNFKNTICFARSEISKKIPEVPKHSNSSLVNNTVNTFNNMHKLNTTTLSVRSHRTANKNKYCNETCANETKFKPHNTVNNKTDNYDISAENNVDMINTKTIVLQSKKSTDVPKSKLNKQKEQNSTIARSKSQSKKSPKEKELTTDKKTISPKNKHKKSETKSRSEKSNSVNVKKSKPIQNNTSAVNNVKKSKNDKHQSKKLNTLKSKHNSRTDSQNDSMRTKKNKPLSQPTHLNLNNTVNPIQNISTSGRPIRSCRTPNQSRSIEQSKKLNTPKSIHNSRRDSQNDSMRTKKNKPLSQLTHLNLNNTVNPIQNISRSGRPIRSCRTPNQRRSIELSGSTQLKNTSVSMRSLR